MSIEPTSTDDRPAPRGLGRREFLRRSAAVGAAAAAGSVAPFFVNRRLYATGGNFATEYVVYLQYSGGVRTYETYDTPSNIPEQWALKSSGLLHREVVSPSNAHDDAKIANIAGARRTAYSRREGRHEKPTVYEYVRKARPDITASECWHVGESSVFNHLLNYSHHADFGPHYGANFISPDAYGRDFRDLLERLAPVDPIGQEHLDGVERFRTRLASGAAEAVDFPIGNTDAERARIAAFLTDLANQGHSGSGDEQALKIAIDLIDAFHPRLMGITLNTHDIGHTRPDRYVESIRESDVLVGRLWSKIQESGNPMRDKTTLIIMPECGRDEHANDTGGWDHSIYNDASTRLVTFFAIGPDIRQGVDLTEHASGAGWKCMQAVPTVAKLLCAETPHVEEGIEPLDAIFTTS